MQKKVPKFLQTAKIKQNIELRISSMDTKIKIFNADQMKNVITNYTQTVFTCAPSTIYSR